MPRPSESTADSNRALAAEIRALVDHLIGNEHPANKVGEAVRALRQVNDALDGLPRDTAYDVTTPSGWAAVREWSPFGGLANPLGPESALSFGTREDGTHVVENVVRFGRAYQGAPGCVHGGVLAAYFDDMFGCPQRPYDFTAVTARLAVSYRAPAPLDHDLTFRTWYEGDLSGKKLTGRGHCVTGDTVVAEVEGLFIKIDLHSLRETAPD